MSNPDIRVSEALRDLAEEFGAKLDAVAGEPVGVIILTFPVGRIGTSNYISNCPRPEMIYAMQQQLKRWNALGDEPDVPAHKVN